MISSEASCSDCRIELITKNWTKLLLKWINKCVIDKKRKREKRLSLKCLSDIMTKYKADVCEDDFERAILCTDDVEPFIKYKYPILRLRYLSEEQDQPKKLFVMTSILLYHCCVSSRTGLIQEDICGQFSKHEQELVLKFCEKLSEMEPTINNVEVAIQGAFACFHNTNEKRNSNPLCNGFDGHISSDTAVQMSSTSTGKSSDFTSTPSVSTLIDEPTKQPARVSPVKFTSDITVLPSVVTDTSTYSDMMVESDEGVAEKGIYVDSDQFESYTIESPKFKRESKKDLDDYQTDEREKCRALKDYDRKRQIYEKKDEVQTQRQPQKEIVFDQVEADVNKETCFPVDDSKNPRGTLDCSIEKCKTIPPSSGDQGGIGTTKPCTCETSKTKPDNALTPIFAKFNINRNLTAVLGGLVIIIAMALVLLTIIITPMFKKTTQPAPKFTRAQRLIEERPRLIESWKCLNNLCKKVNKPVKENMFSSHSRCLLTCSGPQIWPLPIGRVEYDRKIITLATNKLEYKLITVSSDTLQRYLANALKLFIRSLDKLEKAGRNYKRHTDSGVKKMNIQLEVESDPDPRMRLNTEESYQLRIKTTDNQVIIKISSSSFCGVRHGLETLTQMILLDTSTGYLITVSNAVINDSPSFKYRGLMIDTGRNYIPVKDLIRTVDAMATVKLNTFHWRISDATSFPLLLPKLPQLFEFGAYDRSMKYEKDDVQTIVKRAGVRGIRVLIEIAAPGPVGRSWSWNTGATCSSNQSDTCGNELCTILEPEDSVFSILQTLYEEILEMTQVDDMFHLSHGVFSLANCYNLMNNRDGFLDKALDSLKRANKGFLPKLPIIWYTSQLTKDFEAKTWERFGVQLKELKLNSLDRFMAKFKVIHSSKWELSCEMKNQRCKKYRNWQEMYSWKSWRKVEAFTVEGGEAILWTDLVNSGNLDYHLWPRTAAVAERLWSDIVANASADKSVYIRLNNHRTRMLQTGVRVQAIWPALCNYNPELCLQRVELKYRESPPRGYRSL